MVEVFWRFWIVSFGDLRISTYFGSKCGGSKCSLLDPVPLFGNTWNMYVSLTFFGESGRIRVSSPWRAWQKWPEHAGLNSAVQVPRLLQIPALSWIWVVVSIICLFSPPIWRRFPILTNIFSNGLVSNHQLLVVNFHASQLFLPGALPPLRTSCFVNMGEENPSASMALHIPRLSSRPNRFFFQFLNYIVWLHLPPQFSSPLPWNKLFACCSRCLPASLYHRREWGWMGKVDIENALQLPWKTCFGKEKSVSKI